jgi:hypothetical protein
MFKIKIKSFLQRFNLLYVMLNSFCLKPIILTNVIQVNKTANTETESLDVC